MKAKMKDYLIKKGMKVKAALENNKAEFRQDAFPYL